MPRTRVGGIPLRLKVVEPWPLRHLLPLYARVRFLQLGARTHTVLSGDNLRADSAISASTCGSSRAFRLPLYTAKPSIELPPSCWRTTYSVESRRQTERRPLRARTA